MSESLTPEKVSDIVAALCNGADDDRISLDELLRAFGLRAFGLLVLVFALPNGIPAPIAPGLSAVLGAPLLLLSVQMLLGFNTPWFPQSWRARSFRRADVAKLLRPTLPVIIKIERFVRPRLPQLSGRSANRPLGLLLLWNAVLLSLPIPFGNLIPAWAVILAALGQVERDGALVIAALATTVLATGWVWFLLDVGLVLIEKIFFMTADDIIKALKLQPHPEGGHFVETYRDAATDADGRSRSTAIYFLLKQGERSHWHRVDAVEIWHFHAGAPLKLSIAATEGAPVQTITLGGDLAQGQRPQGIVPPHHWQAAETLGEWTLVGCTVAPGFDFAGFELAPPGWSP